jgi:branched-chain amino acid transport system permease protein
LLLQQTLNGLVVGAVYALFALGFTLVFGVLRILNLAHGAIFTWGAFVGLFAVTMAGLPLPMALLLAMVAAGTISVLVDLVAFRPLRRRGAPEFSAIVSSIGAGLILVSLAQKASRTQVMRFPFDAFPVRVFEFAGLRISLLQLTVVASVALMIVLLQLMLFKTSLGRQLRAVAASERTASLLGVNPNFVYLATFFLSGALAGLAGVLIGLSFSSVHFLMGEPFLLRAFVVIVLGGLGSVPGAVAGGLVLGLVQTLAVAFLSSQLADAILFGLLFVLLLLRPSGLFGSAAVQSRVARS